MTAEMPRIPSQCRAAIFHGPDQPLELADVSIPSLEQGEHLVRIRCTTLCGSDVHTMLGERQEPVPTVLGHEATGEVVAMGEADPTYDSPIKVGDRIVWSVCVSCGVCQRCQTLPQKCEQLLKYGHLQAVNRQVLSGGLAEYILLHPNSYLEKVPDALSDELASISNCAVATVMCCFRSALGAGTGSRPRRVLIYGAGMLGLVATAYAEQRRAETIVVVDPNRERLDWALKFGATSVFTPDELSVNLPADFDLVLELSGNVHAVTSAIQAGGFGATIVLAGSARPSDPVRLDPESVLRRCLRIQGVHNYAPEDLTEALRFLEATLEKYPFQDLLSESFALEEVESARSFACRETPLRVVVKP